MVPAQISGLRPLNDAADLVHWGDDLAGGAANLAAFSSQLGQRVGKQRFPLVISGAWIIKTAFETIKSAFLRRLRAAEFADDESHFAGWPVRFAHSLFGLIRKTAWRIGVLNLSGGFFKGNVIINHYPQITCTIYPKIITVVYINYNKI
jgi:hypothetical protein